MSSNVSADIVESRLVDEINERRVKAYNEARDAPSELVGTNCVAEEWDSRSEFNYNSREGEQICSCGNVFCRPVSCEMCKGKCLGQDYEREIKEDCTGWSSYGHSCCCECDGCGYHPEQYKLPNPIPITVSCLSSCSCANVTK